MASALISQESSKKLKEEMKRIKALTTSVLVANPSLQDNTSQMISQIGVLVNGANQQQRN